MKIIAHLKNRVLSFFKDRRTPEEIQQAWDDAKEFGEKSIKELIGKKEGQGQKYLTQMEAMEIVQRKWAENEGLKEACRLIRECAENGGNELWMELTDNVFFYLTKYLGYPWLEKRGENEYLITW